MKRGKVRVKNTEFYLVYKNASAVNKLLQFVKNLEDPSIVNHVALVPKNKTLYVAAKVKPQAFQDLLKGI